MRWAWLLGSVGAAGLVFVACDGDDAFEDPVEGGASTSSGGSSSSTSGSVTSSSSSGGSSTSSSSSGQSSSSGGRDAGVDAGNVGEECVFTGNYGCDPGLRCDCEGLVDCTCQPGARGDGGYNAPCDDGNACETGLCVSGPVPDAGGDAAVPHFCTKVCEAPEECGEPPLSECELTFSSLCIAPE